MNQAVYTNQGERSCYTNLLCREISHSQKKKLTGFCLDAFKIDFVKLKVFFFPLGKRRPFAPPFLLSLVFSSGNPVGFQVKEKTKGKVM